MTTTNNVDPLAKTNSPVMTDGAVCFCDSCFFVILVFYDASQNLNRIADPVSPYLFQAKLIAHRLDLIAKMICVKHPGLTLWLATRNRSKTLVFLCQGNLYVNFF